jgi:glycosyltransferase involved in cell wall biosynthesis
LKSGIAISTYFFSDTHPERNSVFKQCIDSLLESGYPGGVFIIDDGSEDKKHLLYAKNKGVRIIERPDNGGEGRVKNTSLRVLLDAGCEYLFLSDDDMVFHPGWWDAYINAMDTMGMAHMAYVCDGVRIANECYCGVDITRPLAPTTNGCFLTMTRNVPETIGGWPIGRAKFGHLHENFSMRCLKYGLIPFYCDLRDKKKYVELNARSGPCRSGKWKISEEDENLYLLVNPPMWEPILE